MEQSGAEHKFLNIPELISRLASMLDPVSTLVQSQAVNKETLQKAFLLEPGTRLSDAARRMLRVCSNGSRPEVAANTALEKYSKGLAFMLASTNAF